MERAAASEPAVEAAPAPRRSAPTRRIGKPAIGATKAALPKRISTPLNTEAVFAPRNVEHLFKDVYFTGAKDEIAAPSLKGLDDTIPALVTIMQRLPKMRMVIVAHADPASESGRAEAIADARALRVHAYLIGHGIPPSRIKRINRGAQEPLVTSGNTSQNRRVDIFVYPE
jgi:outer membrane protein OmpA-like peptidoglycan-associated protein